MRRATEIADSMRYHQAKGRRVWISTITGRPAVWATTKSGESFVMIPMTDDDLRDMDSMGLITRIGAGVWFLAEPPEVDDAPPQA